MRGARGLAAAVALLAACAHGPARTSGPAPGGAPNAAGGGGRVQVGLASYYGPRHHGRRTASGARFDMHALTCAHRSAPFGSRLRVTALESGRSVVVTVTDRGPFARGRVVDLSVAAARELGMIEDGVVKVRVEPVE